MEAPPFKLHPADLVRGDAEDGEISDAGRGAVFPAEQKTKQVERGAQGFTLEGAEEGSQAGGLGHEHAAEVELAVAGAGVGEAHVEFD